MVRTTTERELAEAAIDIALSADIATAGDQLLLFFQLEY